MTLSCVDIGIPLKFQGDLFQPGRHYIEEGQLVVFNKAEKQKGETFFTCFFIALLDIPFSRKRICLLVSIQ
jgi:hypothetical protein